MALPQGFEKQADLPKQYTMGYLKKDGDKVKVRIVSDFIQGKSVWGEKDGKPFPYRFRLGEQVQVGCIGINNRTGEPNRITTFIAAVVFNYTNKQTEVLEVNKRSIMDAIYDIEQNEDWGDSKEFDLTISRSGEGFSDTKYSVLPSNKKKFSGEVEEVNLEALFSGGNPFSKEEKPVTDEEAREALS